MQVKPMVVDIIIILYLFLEINQKDREYTRDFGNKGFVNQR